MINFGGYEYLTSSIAHGVGTRNSPLAVMPVISIDMRRGKSRRKKGNQVKRPSPFGILGALSSYACAATVAGRVN